MGFGKLCPMTMRPSALRMSAPLLPALETLPAECASGVDLGVRHGFRLGIENNSPEGQLHVEPAECRELLDEVPGLGFVWDLNHTQPQDMAGFEHLTARAQMLHVSDTQLPATNHHLPLGSGNLPFADCLRAAANNGFDGPLVLEIGGHASSGGHGRDTDLALSESLRAVKEAWFLASRR